MDSDQIPMRRLGDRCSTGAFKGDGRVFAGERVEKCTLGDSAVTLTCVSDCVNKHRETLAK